MLQLAFGQRRLMVVLDSRIRIRQLRSTSRYQICEYHRQDTDMAPCERLVAFSVCS